MENVILRNGSQAPKDKIIDVVEALAALRKQDVLLFAELVYYCREPKPGCFGGQKQQLVEFGLADTDGSIDEIVRNIVLSSVEGEELRQVTPFFTTQEVGGEMLFEEVEDGFAFVPVSLNRMSEGEAAIKSKKGLGRDDKLGYAWSARLDPRTGKYFKRAFTNGPFNGRMVRIVGQTF